ncbi:MAG: PAS domain S-box protein [Bacteroidetes bacterium]|nr:PAS domain S-box protein [Bacteroidota bacterium]
MEPQKEIDLLKRRLEREISSRKQAEAILEKKAVELYEANLQLRKLNENLEQEILDRTKALKASELRYRQIVENANDIIYRADAQGYFTYANKTATRLLGYSQEDIIGRHFIEFVHPDWREEVEVFYKKCRDENMMETYLQFPVLTKEGEIIWLAQHVQFIISEGAITEAAAVARDFTKRKLAEDQLKNTQLRLTSLIANLQSGILVEDENRRIVLANERFCKKFNIPVPPEMLVGTDCSQSAEQSKHLFADPDKFIHDVEFLLKEKQTRVGDEIQMADGRILSRDYIPVFGEGEYMGHLWQYRDITEQRQADEKLRLSEEKYRVIIENMELGLLEVDNLGRIGRAYQRFCDMVGYSEAELVGKKANDILLPDEFLPVMKQQAIDRIKGKASVYEIQLIKKNGSRIWVMISGAPIFNQWGKVIGTIGIHYDVTAQRRLQQELFEARLRAEEAQEAEKQFLANMSHEIRTPLNAIIGMTHLLYDTEPTTDQHNFLDILKYSSEMLRYLINDLLDISKIRAGKMELHNKEFDLGGLVRTLQKTFQLKLESKPVDVESKVDARLDTLVIGDDLLLNQILMNLVGNAEKFTAEGKIGIRASIVGRARKTLKVRFEVYDTGIGIPSNKLELIFQSFRQVDGDIRRRYGGTGLGLSIVKNLVELHGGTIWVESVEGQGSTFIFEIEFKDTGKPISTVVQQHKFVRADFSNNFLVLIVEDNSMNRRYLSSLFKKWNVAHKMAINGREGLEMAQAETFDLIFMDIQMPEMDGYEASIAIRSTANPNRETPIVALTASAMLSRKDKAFQAGMNDYVSKPFTPEQIYLVLEKYLKIEEKRSSEVLEMPALENAGEEAKPNTANGLDRAYLQELYGDDREYALEMFDAFLEKINSEYVLLHQMSEQKDWRATAKLAHKLKPTFPMAGLTWLEADFQILEDQASKGEDETSIQLIIKQINEKVAVGLPMVLAEANRLRGLAT